jgi:quinol monooxygenase YgiN
LIITTAIIKFDPANEAAMLAEAEKMGDLTEQEPGCRRAELALNVKQKGEFLAFQVWDDVDSFKSHVGAMKGNPERATWESMVLDVKGTFYEATEFDALAG